MVTVTGMMRLARRLGRMISVLVPLSVACGIFTPRDSEVPEIPERIDPLNFRGIMEAIGSFETFTKVQFEDLFGDDLYYDDINSGAYAKTQLIQRLRQIQVQYPLIKVEWSGGAYWRRTDTIIVSELRYAVFPDGNESGTPAESGSSNFRIVKDWEWRIAEWRDSPDKQTKSFFSP
jgi:hypothetical protein